MSFTAFFCNNMVRKINGCYFLSRQEAVDYLMHAYGLSWCLTSWRNGFIKISYQTSNAERFSFLVSPYKVRNLVSIQLSQKELDAKMYSMLGRD